MADILQFGRERPPVWAMQVKWEDDVRHARNLYHAGDFATVIWMCAQVATQARHLDHPLSLGLEQDLRVLIENSREGIAAKKTTIALKGQS